MTAALSFRGTAVRPILAILLIAGRGALLVGQSVPATINYQGRITDNTPSQTPVNGTTNMQFEIWDLPSGGSAGTDRLWREPNFDNAAVLVPVSGGIFNWVLGSSNPIPPGVFSGASSARYLQIIVNPGASQELLTPRQLITATGYANLAQNANSAVTAASATTATSATNSAQLGGVAASGYLLTTGTAADSSKLGGSSAANYQQRTAAGAFTCSGLQVLQAAAADGAPTCVTPTAAETDPKVGSLTTGRVPRWNATSLVDGSIFDTGTRIGVGTTGPIAPLHVAGATPASVGTGPTNASPYSVFVEGRYAYVVNLNGNTLQAFDVSNPAAIVLVGSAATGNGPDAVFVQGRYAYVTLNSAASFQVFDISNPAAIGAAAGTAVTGTQPFSVYVRGRYAYVVNFTSNTLQIFDVSNPATIGAAVGSIATGTSPSHVEVRGRYAYVTTYTGNTLQVFDVSNPAAISLAGSAAVGGNPYDVRVQGRYAFVVNIGPDTLQAFDVTNPAAIGAAVGSAPTGSFPDALQVEGRYAYVVNSISSTLQVFDISNPASIGTALASGPTGTNPGSLFVQGRYAYVTNSGSNTLQAIDLGGAYLQQLESGGIETGSLAARGNARIDGDLSVRGALSTGIGGIATDGRVGIGVYVNSCAPNANPYTCACTGSDVLAGGGGTGTAANGLFSSRPNGAGWLVQCATGNCAAAYAICLRHGN